MPSWVALLGESNTFPCAEYRGGWEKAFLAQYSYFQKEEISASRCARAGESVRADGEEERQGQEQSTLVSSS